LSQLVGYSLGIFGVLERAVLVLCLDVAVDIFHEEKDLEIAPVLELLLGGVDGLSCKILPYGSERIAGDHYVPLLDRQFLLQLDNYVVVHHYGSAVCAPGTEEHLVNFELVGRFADGRSHYIVHLIAGIGDAVVDPEG